MTSILKSLKMLADPSRARLVALLEQEELSVAELQDILGMGQSTLSTHLAQLKRAGIVEDRRAGKNILYRLRVPGLSERARFDHLMALLREAAGQLRESEDDVEALQLIKSRRRDRVRSYFDELAGRFGRQYVPGRSWQGLAETLSVLLPPIVIADLGAGEGSVAQLLARRVKRVIAVDNSGRMVEYGTRQAREHSVRNLEYRQGDLEDIPIQDDTVDVALFSQSLHHAQRPERALLEAYRILKPGGRIIVLDLVRHGFEQAREMYADVWLGFTEVEARRLMKNAGFTKVCTSIVHRETKTPHFETMLAVGDKRRRLPADGN